MKQLNLLMTIAGLFALSLNACRNDDELPSVPQPVVNEPEQITTVELHFDKASDQSHFHATWSDPDGPGGNDPMVDDILLDTFSVYTVEVHFYDESGDSADELTGEILAENDEHIICFALEPSSLNDVLTVVRTDNDGTYEVGLTSEWTTTEASSGTLTLSLKHQVGGEKDGTCEPGDTDVEVIFNVSIQ